MRGKTGVRDIVRFRAGRRTRRERNVGLSVSFNDSRGVRGDKAARGDRRVKEGRESRRFCRGQD
jgi:hypothetical protein